MHGKKMDSFWLFVMAGTFVFILIIGMIIFNDSNEMVSGDDPVPGFDDEFIELDINTPVTFPLQDALNIVNTNAIITDLENISYNPDLGESHPDDETSEYQPNYKLVEDKYLCETFWVINKNNNNLEIHVNAENGEINQVSNVIMTSGTLSKQAAIDQAQSIITAFAPTLGTLTPDYVSYTNLTEHDISENLEVATGYVIEYYRFVQGVNTTDKIHIEIDSSGNIVSFIKIWNLEMPLSLIPQISSEIALETLNTYFNDTGNPYQTSLMVVRPNYLYEGEGPRYGFNNGILAWVFEYEYTFTDNNEIKNYFLGCFVDANENEIIGGY